MEEGSKAKLKRSHDRANTAGDSGGASASSNQPPNHNRAGYLTSEETVAQLKAMKEAAMRSCQLAAWFWWAFLLPMKGVLHDYIEAAGTSYSEKTKGQKGHRMGGSAPYLWAGFCKGMQKTMAKPPETVKGGGAEILQEFERLKQIIISHIREVSFEGSFSFFPSCPLRRQELHVDDCR